MEKQMTALMQSIERKKERVKALQIMVELNSRQPLAYDSVIMQNYQIGTLLYEISEDEKLLKLEREHIEDAHKQGFYVSETQNSMPIQTAEDYYKNKYKAE